MSASDAARLMAVVLIAGLTACSSAPPAAPTPAARSSTPPAKTQGPAPEPVPVKLSTLDTSGRHPTDTTRNPFRFEPKAVPAAPRPVVAPSVAERPVPVTPAVPVGPPPIPLKFLGIVVKGDGVKWAVLSDGKLPIFGREADIIGGQYRIVSIGAESIELTYADGRGRQTIRLTGQ